MSALRSSLDWVSRLLLAVLMAGAVLNVLWQVASRYLLGNPSSFTDELARYLLIWLGLFGSAYALGSKMHLAIDLLPTSLHGRRQQYLALFIDALVLLFALLVMVVGGLRLVSLTFLLGQTSAALRVPLGYVYLALPASGVLMVVYSLMSIRQHLRGAEPVVESTATTGGA